MVDKLVKCLARLQKAYELQCVDFVSDLVNKYVEQGFDYWGIQSYEFRFIRATQTEEG